MNEPAQDRTQATDEQREDQTRSAPSRPTTRPKAASPKQAKKTQPSAQTREAERQDAMRTGGPDRPPTPDEEQLAGESHADPDVAEHYEEMTELGVESRGEGRIGLD